MWRIGILLIVLATTLPGRAEDWTTADGKTYKNVTVLGQEEDGIRITYTGGVGKIPYYELSDDLLMRFGQDPVALAAKRAAMRKAAAEAALKAQQDAIDQKKSPDESASSRPQSVNPTQPLNPALPENQAQQASGAPKPSPAGNPVPGQENSTQPSGPSTSYASRPVGEPSPYPNSRFQYDENGDVCYLDSYSIQVAPLSLDPAASPTTGAASQDATLFLRITTEGRRAEAPDQVQGTFVSPIALKKLETDHKVRFLVDGTYISALAPLGDDGSGTPAPPDLNRVTFLLTPQQMHTLILGKNLDFSVGSYNYTIDNAGITALRGYLTDVDRLPPASTNLVRSYHRFLQRLPSIISVISTTCEYIILGAFALVMVASIAAFIMGLTRFIKM